MTHFDLPHTGNITRRTLDNGMTILVYPTPHVQSVTVHGYLRVGRWHEPKTGVAHFTAQSLMNGTQTRDFDAIHSTLEDIGADLAIYASATNTHFSGKALAEDLPVLLDLLHDCLRYPTFPEERLSVMRLQALTTLKYLQQDTRHQAMRTFEEALYPTAHPYRGLGIGSLDTVPLLTREDCEAFHAQHYSPHGMTLIIVGAVNPTDALDRVEEQFATWHAPANPTQVLPIVQPPQTMQRTMTPIAGKTQSDLIIGTLAPSRHDPDYIPASLANSILGEFGMMGRLGSIIREELGLAYYASSRLEMAEGQASWYISAGVAPHNVNLAIEKAIEQIQHMVNEPVSASDLADNQSYYTGRLPLRLESPSGIAGSIEQMERYGLGFEYLAQYRDMIYSVTRDDLLRAMRRFWNPQALIISVAGAE